MTLRSTATRALVDAMARQEVRRLVCITGMGAGDIRGHGGFVFDRLVFPLLLRKVYADKDRQEDIVRSSGADWVLVRPTVLNDQPARGSVRAVTDLSGLRGGTIARADVAKFVVDQLADDPWLRRSAGHVGKPVRGIGEPARPRRARGGLGVLLDRPS